jgi:hypothetical protein
MICCAANRSAETGAVAAERTARYFRHLHELFEQFNDAKRYPHEIGLRDRIVLKRFNIALAICMWQHLPAK